MGDHIPPEAAGDPTYKKYNLKCKVKFFKTSIREDIGRGKIAQYDRTLVLLVPQDSDECYRFYAAWLPDVPEQHFELVGVLGSPVNSPSRLSVHMGHDKKSDRPYLFVMSKGVEDIITGHIKEGTLVNVITLPANEDSEADFAQDASDGNFQVYE